MTHGTRPCRHCDREFPLYRRDKAFCDHRCRIRYWRGEIPAIDRLETFKEAQGAR